MILRVPYMTTQKEFMTTLQRYVISRITRPITFKGTISADETWKAMKNSKYGYGADDMITNIGMVSLDSSKPSKAWRKAYNRLAGANLREIRMKRRYNTP